MNERVMNAKDGGRNQRDVTADGITQEGESLVLFSPETLDVERRALKGQDDVRMLRHLEGGGDGQR